MASTYLDYLTYSTLNGVQNFDSADWFIDTLRVHNFTSVITNVDNATVTNYNVTGDHDVYGTANFYGDTTGISLDEIEDLTTDKTFTMGGNTLEWRFTNPVGGMLWSWDGGAQGHLIEMVETVSHANGGHVLHVNATSPNMVAGHFNQELDDEIALLVTNGIINFTNADNFYVKNLKVLDAPVECPTGYYMTRWNGSESVCVLDDDSLYLKNGTDANLTGLNVEGDITATKVKTDEIEDTSGNDIFLVSGTDLIMDTYNFLVVNDFAVNGVLKTDTIEDYDGGNTLFTWASPNIQVGQNMDVDGDIITSGNSIKLGNADLVFDMAATDTGYGRGITFDNTGADTGGDAYDETKYEFGRYKGIVKYSGTNPELRFIPRKTGGGSAGHIMKVEPTNIGTGASATGGVGYYVGTSPPSLSYMFFCFKDKCDYNSNATLKIDSQGTLGRVGIALDGSTRPSYPLHVATNESGISIYSEANVSATGYITRSNVYDKDKGSALDLIKDSDDWRNPDGSIDKESHYAYTTYSKKVCHFEGNINKTQKEVCEVIEEEGFDVETRIATLEQAVFELKTKN